MTDAQKLARLLRVKAIRGQCLLRDAEVARAEEAAARSDAEAAHRALAERRAGVADAWSMLRHEPASEQAHRWLGQARAGCASAAETLDERRELLADAAEARRAAARAVLRHQSREAALAARHADRLLADRRQIEARDDDPPRMRRAS